MEESKNIEQADERKRLRQVASFFSTFIFLSLFGRLSDYFEDKIGFFIFTLFWFLLYGNIQYFIGRSGAERFDAKHWLKRNGIFILVILFLTNVYTFLNQASENVPNSVSSWFAPILIIGAVLFLIGSGIYFIEKHSKP